MTRAPVVLLLVFWLGGCASQAPLVPSRSERLALEENRRGVAAEAKGELAAARAHFQAARQAYAAIEHQRGLLTTLLNQAQVEQQLARPEAVLELCADALPLTAAVPELATEVHFLRSRAELSLRQHAAAQASAATALRLAEPALRGRVRNLQARIAVQQGEGELAATLAGQARVENHASGARAEEAHSWRLLGSAALLRNDLSQARHALQQALALDKAVGSSARIAEDLQLLGQVAQRNGQPDECVAFWQRALAVRLADNDRPGAATLLTELAALRRAQGDAEGAAVLLEQQRQLRAE